MARLTVSQKASQVLLFLMGLRYPRPLALLAQHGFTAADAEEGWALLKATTKYRFDATTGPVQVDPKVVAEVDAWENRWFEIIDASLTRRFPEVRAKVFANLSQTEGPPALLSVGTLVERVTALAAESASQQERNAAALLAQRGLTPAALSEIRALLASAEVPVAAPDLDVTEESAAQQEAAEATLWAWYLEWSAIARKAITDRRQLRLLGFLRTKSTKEDEEEEAVQPTPTVVAQPATD